MLKLILKVIFITLLGVVGFAAPARAQSNVDHPGICPGYDRAWRAVAGGTDLAAMDRVIKRIPAQACPNLRAEARRTRAAAARVTQTPAPIETPAPVDVCADTRSRWPQLDGRGTIAQLRAFLSSTPSPCTRERGAAQNQLTALEQAERARQTEAERLRQAEAQRQRRARPQTPPVVASGRRDGLPSTAGVKVGSLTCNIASGFGFLFGSSKELRCTYSPNSGTGEHYAGTFSKYGLDIGYADKGVLVWAVVARSSDVRSGALEGDYGGALEGDYRRVGLGANVLIGGLDKSIALQPLSVSGSTGLNIAAGVGVFSLKHAEQQASPSVVPQPKPPQPGEEQPTVVAAVPSNAGVEVGLLSCYTATFASVKDVHCAYAPGFGHVSEHYTATFSKYGLDIGYDDGFGGWQVWARSSDVRSGALEGDYGGALEGDYRRVGLGANVLIGGLDRSIALRPIGGFGNFAGLKIAPGVGVFSLKLAK